MQVVSGCQFRQQLHHTGVIALAPVRVSCARRVSAPVRSHLGSLSPLCRTQPSGGWHSAKFCRIKQPKSRQQLKAVGFLQKLFKQDPAENTRKKYQPFVDQTNAFEPKMKSLTDEQLRAKTDEFRNRLARGEVLEKLLPEVFAVVREASWRVLGLRPFDVQLMGGMVLHEGQIAEMRTGEGKTLVAALPSYLNALTGKGVHVVTVNDYLARRDSEWVGQVPRFLGMNVGLIQQDMTSEQRRKAYAADITYVTNSELGFDFLRDNLAVQANDLVLRPFNFCVIDEVDSILIDEARTPLIISGVSDKPSDKYYKAAKLADALARDVHYTVDEKQRSVLLSEEGYEAVEEVLGVADLYDPRTQWASYIINALKAKELFKKDVNYIVKAGEIVIVDEFTGRTMPGRRWSDGQHQAMEAKEGLEIKNESVTLASISYQAFFRSFPKLAGMTGTAATEVSEFDGIYKLSVAVVPTNRPITRQDNPDVVFRIEKYKWAATVTEIKRMHRLGRAVLVGTTSVEKSEVLSEMLREEGIPHQVLNAKPENVERESEIVAQSGRKGAVTISTNMAGRGTDILLGGNADYMARLKIRELLFPLVVSQVEDGDANPFARGPDGKPRVRSWKVAPELYPCELSQANLNLALAAVKAAEAAWGSKSLTALEAEDRLAVAVERGVTEDQVTLQLRQAYQAALKEFKDVTEVEKAEVVALGGLHVIGTERHESRRIDNQLRGRSGRQGDPGSTRFFLSLEDNLFRIFGGDKIKNMMVLFQVEDLPMESQMLTDALDTAQKRVENYFFDIRKNLFEYDQVVNSQRDKVYSERRKALLATDLASLMVEYAEKTADDIVAANIPRDVDPSEWKLDILAAKLVQYCPMMGDLNGQDLANASKGDWEALRSFCVRASREAYFAKAGMIDSVEPGLMQEAQRYFLLTQTDNLWKEHLQAIKFLQQAVGMRGYAGKDPLTEFKLEAYNLFVEMTAQIRRNVIYNIYVFQPKRLTPVEEAEGEQRQIEQQPVAAVASKNGNGAAKQQQPAKQPVKAKARGGKK